MALALRYHVLANMIQADDRLAPAELTELSKLDGPLRNAGLMAYDGTLLAAYQETLDEALTRMPAELSMQEKLSFLAQAFAGAMVDDDFDATERALLDSVAELLGVEESEYAAWVRETFPG